MRNQRISWISAGDPAESFPATHEALTEPNGLLAAGGDLSPERLLYAYRHGIFPWYDDGQPILWWSPDPRCVIQPDAFHLSRSLRRALRQSSACLSFNTDFAAVVDACSGPRRAQQGTWITPQMRQAYVNLRQLGWAHSAEIRQDGELIGGIYGLAIGKMFFGESMFSHRSNASKMALFGLCETLRQHKFALLDCQVVSPHLLSLGASTRPRQSFLAVLEEACNPANAFSAWPGGAIPVRSLLPGSGPAALQ